MFKDRAEAGQKLARKLVDLIDLEKIQGDFVVLGIPCGGVVVGKEIARALACPLEVVVAKKIAAPGNEELAVGAAGPNREIVWNEEMLKSLGLNKEELKLLAQRAIDQAQEAKREFGGGDLRLTQKIVILADDGVATGATIEMAVKIISRQNPKKLIIAIPVIAKDSLGKIQKLADEVIFLEAPEMFFAVGQFYQEYHQMTNEEILGILRLS